MKTYFFESQRAKLRVDNCNYVEALNKFESFKSEMPLLINRRGVAWAKMYSIEDSSYSQGQPILVEYHIFTSSTDRWEPVHLSFTDWFNSLYTGNYNTLPRRYALQIAFEYKKYCAEWGIQENWHQQPHVTRR